jgi:transposase
MAKRVRLWQSENWLRRKYLHENMSEEAIAKLAGTSQVTINAWLKRFGLRK